MKFCALVHTTLLLLLSVLQGQGTFGERISHQSILEGDGGIKHLNAGKVAIELDRIVDWAEQNHTPFRTGSKIPVDHISETEEPSPYSPSMMQMAFLILVAVTSYAYFGEKQAEYQKKVEIASLSDGHLVGKPAILSIATANPPHRWSQEDVLRVLDWKKDNMNLNDDFVDFMKRMHADNGVDYRYGGVPPPPPGHLESGGRPYGIPGQDGNPTAGTRHTYWDEWAPKMAIEAATKAVSEWGGNKDDITHVVFHSCTGFKAPGVELDVIDALKLTGVKRRLGINYMGCFGGFTGMSVAKAFCEADPSAHVLVVCAEACSAHYAFCNNRSKNIGNSFFADGAAAAVIGPGRPGDWVINSQMTKTLGVDTRGLMTWEPNDHGYEMYLDKGIGKKFGLHLYWNLKSYFKEICKQSARDVEWCVHPGGKGILDFFCSRTLNLGVDKSMLRRSYDVLRQHGNMSSGTIFFVLKELMKDAQQRPTQTKKSALCLGFGPGLTLEVAHLRRIGTESS